MIMSFNMKRRGNKIGRSERLLLSCHTVKYTTHSVFERGIVYLFVPAAKPSEIQPFDERQFAAFDFVHAQLQNQ